MTEQEWLHATDPKPMWEFLRGKANERKLRLFEVAFCRRMWNLLTDERSRRGVETAEQDVEGGVAKDGMDQERSLSHAAFMEVRASESMAGEHIARCERAFIYPPHPIFADYSTTLGDTQGDAIFAAEGMIYMAESRPKWRGIPEEHRSTLLAYQSNLFRDLFGNPFRPVAVDPSWLAWHDGLLVSMAQRIYDSRDFRDMPVLADALEEAGCANQDVLSHCRNRGDHVRGCWVIDCILGKE
jgi:hypothetical protein